MKNREELRMEHRSLMEDLEAGSLLNVLDTLSEMITTLEDDDLAFEQKVIRDTFFAMLSYFEQGQSDPMREKLFQQLLNNTRVLNQRVLLARMERSCKGLYFAQLQRQRNRPQTPADFQAMLRRFAEDWSMAALTHDKKSLEDFRREWHNKHDLFNCEVFKRSWGTPFWNKLWEESATDLLNAELISAQDKALFLSGVTLGALEVFDARKVTFHLTAALHPEPLISQRAIVGLLLLILTYPQELQSNASLLSALTETFQPGTRAAADLCIALEIFLRTDEWEELNRRIKEEVLPELKKQQRLKKEREGRDEDDDLNEERLLQHIDMEWIENSPRLQKQAEEIQEMQKKGCDIYFESFGHLKHFQFFREISSWFCPFDPQHAVLQTPSAQKLLAPGALLPTLMQMSLFCDSDQYSFALTVAEMPQHDVKQLLGGLPIEPIANLSDLLKGEGGATFNRRITCQKYIHSLNRFFKYFLHHHEFTDPFGRIPEFMQEEWWKKILFSQPTPENTAVADYCFKQKHYDYASALYAAFCDSPQATAQQFQQLGYCHEQCGEHWKASCAYSQALLLLPDDPWTERHLAYCFDCMKFYDSSLALHEKILEREPENPATLLALSRCYAFQGAYDSAMSLLYKLVYLRPNSRKARLAMAEVALQRGKLDEAKKNIQHYLASGATTAAAEKLAGDIAFSSHSISEALQHYRRAIQMDATIAILQDEESNPPHYADYGWTETDLALMSVLLKRAR